MTLESPGGLRRSRLEQNTVVTRRELEKLHKEMNDFKKGTRSILTEILKLVDRSEELHRNYPATSITIKDLLRQIEEL